MKQHVLTIKQLIDQTHNTSSFQCSLYEKQTCGKVKFTRASSKKLSARAFLIHTVVQIDQKSFSIRHNSNIEVLHQTLHQKYELKTYYVCAHVHGKSEIKMNVHCNPNLDFTVKSLSLKFHSPSFKNKGAVRSLVLCLK